jgi:hypothetical protein
MNPRRRRHQRMRRKLRFRFSQADIASAFGWVNRDPVMFFRVASEDELSGPPNGAAP